MDLATWAAFTAAGVALIVGIFSVVWGSRLASRSQLEKWRRSREWPIVARMLALSRDARHKWAKSSQTRMDVMQDPEVMRAESLALWRAGSELLDKLRYEAAQLELFAGPPVVLSQPS
jgi:hypothetical protein